MMRGLQIVKIVLYSTLLMRYQCKSRLTLHRPALLFVNIPYVSNIHRMFDGRCERVYNGRMDIKQIAQRVLDGQAEDGDAKAMAEYILRSIEEDKAGLLLLLDTIKTTHSSVGYEWADKDTPGR